MLPLVVILGPTASGKTKIAVDLALRLGGEIISGDSMQVYRYMDIGTAKVKPAETKGIPHHLIDLKEKSIDKFIICNNQDISESIDDSGSSIEEMKANYFAAAFLMPKVVIENRFSNLKNRKYSEVDLVLEIMKLQYEYEIPYKTILKRLKELGIIGNEKYHKLKDYDEQILEYCKMLDEEMRKRINELEHSNARKYHSLNVPKIAYDVYRNNIISISKLKSVVNKYGKTLNDFKVVKPEVNTINIDFSNFGTGDDTDEED